MLYTPNDNVYDGCAIKTKPTGIPCRLLKYFFNNSTKANAMVLWQPKSSQNELFMCRHTPKKFSYEILICLFHMRTFKLAWIGHFFGWLIVVYFFAYKWPSEKEYRNKSIPCVKHLICNYMPYSTAWRNIFAIFCCSKQNKTKIL